ncbi:MAG: RnfABCDGE type electron transport complex subunit D [Treponema sp.]|nr:RnfABCDGE type electron transport complex subunit D [Treponema sp.]
MSNSVNMIVSPAPHIREKITTNRIMLDVIIALSPSFVIAVWVFGLRAALVTGVCVAACVFFEWAYEKFLKRKNTIGDLSAVLTGILLAFNLPVTIPLWQAVFGCFIAIILVKQLFGGLGKNFANPAITARVIMLLAFPAAMTTWVLPFWGAAADVITFPTPLDAVTAATTLDGLTGATPLVALLQMFRGEAFEALPSMWNLFLGVHGGSLGETSELALLIGGLYLIIRRVITWHVPVTFIATVFILTTVIGGFNFEFGLLHMLTGGLFLGAIFMATDYVTSPQTNLGRAIFGIGCGLITVLIRLYGNYPEGVSFAILLMNMIVPFINKISCKKALGELKS